MGHYTYFFVFALRLVDGRYMEESLPSPLRQDTTFWTATDQREFKLPKQQSNSYVYQ